METNENNVADPKTASANPAIQQTKKCDRCGKEIQSDYLICPFCGKKQGKADIDILRLLKLCFLAASLLFLFIGTIVMIYAALGIGSILYFIGAAMGLGLSIVSVISFVSQKKKDGFGIFQFVLDCAYGLLFVITGIMWMAIVF
jgi:hypothetical protein